MPTLIDQFAVGTSDSGGTSGSRNTTGANLIVAFASWYISGTAPTISDSKGNTWTPLTASDVTTVGSKLWYCLNPNVGTGHTLTISGVSAFISMGWVALSGASTFKSENRNSGFGTSISTGSVSYTTGDIIITSIVGENNAQSFTIDNSFTAIGVDYSSGNYEGGAIAYLITNNDNSVNPTWSWTNYSADISTVIAVFAPAPVVNDLNLSATLTNSGSLVRQKQKSLLGSITESVEFNKTFVSGIQYSGILTNSSIFVRQDYKSFSISLGQNGQLLKQDWKSLSNSLLEIGNLTQINSKPLSLTGDLNHFSLLVNQVQKNFIITVSLVGNCSKQIFKLISRILSSSSSLFIQGGQTLSGIASWVQRNIFLRVRR